MAMEMRRTATVRDLANCILVFLSLTGTGWKEGEVHFLAMVVAVGG